MGFVTVVAMDARTAQSAHEHLISLAQQRTAAQQACTASIGKQWPASSEPARQMHCTHVLRIDKQWPASSEPARQMHCTHVLRQPLLLSGNIGQPLPHHIVSS
jgi:hypothetical protein